MDEYTNVNSFRRLAGKVSNDYRRQGDVVPIAVNKEFDRWAPASAIPNNPGRFNLRQILATFGLTVLE